MDDESKGGPLSSSPAEGSGRPGMGGWDGLASFLNRYQHILLAVALAAGLALFLAILPGYIRTALARSIRSQRVLAGMLLLFSLLALSLLWSAGQRLDAWAFLFFNLRGARPAWLDWLMLAFTQLGNGVTALFVAFFLFSTGLHRLAYELVLGTLTLWLVVELVKAIVRRSRPFVKLSQTRIVGYRERGRSFPSGHTSQAFFVATMLAQYFHLGLWAALTLYTLAALIAITRMYVGAHYPRDVLAGAILGSVWGLLGVLVDARFLVGRG